MTTPYLQVARSVGPLFTALWAYLVLDQSTTGVPLACLAATLAGTALASWKEPSFCALTFFLMLTVNATLTFRNAATKRLLQRFPAQNPALLASVLLTLTSAVGTVAVTMLWGAALAVGHAGASMLPASLASYRHLFVLGLYNFAYNLASQLVLATVQVIST